MFIIATVFLLGGIVFALQHTQANSTSPANVAVANQNVVLDSSSGRNNATLKPLALPDSSGIAARDAQRISDLQQIQNDLHLYYDKCGYYPGVAQPGGSCGAYAAVFTWADLTTALAGSNLGITSVPDDPTAGTDYFYGAKAGATGYVLGATLEDPTNPALAQSVGGFVNGVRCTNPVYCVKQ